MTLKEWFKERGMTQAEFARRINVERTTIHFWLTGKNHPTYKNYLKIKEITEGKVTYEEFFKTQIQSTTSKYR